MTAPTAATPARDGPGHPQRGGVGLRVSVEGDADHIEVRWPGLVAAVVERRVAAPPTRQVHIDGLSWQKPPGARQPMALRARLRALRLGKAPALRLRVIGTGGVVVEVRSDAGVLLGRATVRGAIDAAPPAAPGPAPPATTAPPAGATALSPIDPPGVVTLPLAATRLDALPALAVVRPRRLALAFYYAWYGTPLGPTGRYRHWDPKARNHASHDTPVGGWYDSADPEVIERHMQQAKQAGLDGLLVSHWGRHEPGDALLQRLLDAAQRHGLFVAPYLEQSQTTLTLRHDAHDLASRLGRHPAFLRIDGKPALFFYVRLEQELGRDGLRVALAGLPVYSCAVGLDPLLMDAADALHTYFHAQAYERYVGGSDDVWLASRLRGRRVVATVMPAYDDRSVRQPGFALPADGGRRWRHDWALAQGADVVLLTSFNEWHEGSQIEPSLEHGETRLQATRAAIEAWRGGP